MYLHPCVLISCFLVAIPTQSFGVLVTPLEIDANFLAGPPRSPPCPLLVVIALGVWDVFWRYVGKAVPSVFGAILATCRIFLLFFVFIPSFTRAAACPVGCGYFSSRGVGGGVVIGTWTGMGSGNCVAFLFPFVCAILFVALRFCCLWSWRCLHSPRCSPIGMVGAPAVAEPTVAACSSPD